MVKRDGQWDEVDWQEALDVVAARACKGRDFGVLASPHATLEELYLAGEAGRRPTSACATADFSADGKRAGIPWLGMPVAELQQARPRAGGRLVPAQGPSADRAPPAPGRQARRADPHAALGGRRLADAGRQQEDRAALGDRSARLPRSRRFLKAGKNAAVLLGNFAQQHPQAAQIHAAAQALRRARSASSARRRTRSAATSPACRPRGDAARC